MKTLFLFWGTMLISIAGMANDAEARIDSLFAQYTDLAYRSFEQRSYDSAIHYCQQAIALPLVDSTRKGRRYHQLGNAYYYTGKYDLARVAYQHALDLFLLTDDSLRIHNGYYNMGFIHQQRNDYVQSLDYLFKALEIRTHCFGAYSESASEAYNMIGVAYHYLEDYDHALLYHHKALEVRRELYGDIHRRIAGSYNNLGMVYDKLKRYEEAIAAFDKATEIRIQTVGPRSAKVAGGYLNAGHCYGEMKQYDKAMEYYQKALSIYIHDLGPTHPKVIGAYGNISKNHLELAQYEEALQTAHKGLMAAASPSLSSQILDVYQNPLPDELLVHVQTIYTLRSKGIALWHLFQESGRMVDLIGAYQTFELGMDFLLRLRELPLAKQSQQRWRAQGITLYQGALDAALALYAVHRDRIWLDKAFYIAESAKAALLYADLLEEQAKLFADLPEELLEQETQLRKRIGELEKEVALMQVDSQADERRYVHLQSLLLAPKDSLHTLVQQLERKYPSYFQLKNKNEPASLTAIQQSMSTSEDLMIQYAFGREQLHMLAISQDTIVSYSVEVDSLRRRVMQLQRILRDPSQVLAEGNYSKGLNRFQEIGYHLYRDLLAPILQDHPKSKRLIILPDSYLAYLPFELLLREQTAYTSFRQLAFLLGSYTIRYEFSASIMLHGQSSSVSAQGQWVGFAPDAPSASSQFAPLRHTEREIQSVQAISKGKVFDGADATESRLKSIFQEAGILHIASHAFTEDKNPALSYLLFSEDSTSQEDAQLYAYELYQSKLSAHLVVLSACNTGYGPLADGEGVMSLARAFKSAGCHNVVMSLWPVDDESTAMLMEKFYQYLQTGLPKAQALQLAKSDMIHEAPQAHPHYWASFVLIGDDEPVDVGRWTFSFSFLEKILGGFLLCLLLYAIFSFYSDGHKSWTIRSSSS